MKYTKGEWEAYNAGDEGDTYIGTKDGEIICEHVKEDNAQLIAYAPLLYKALNDLVMARVLKMGKSVTELRWIRAEEALAKMEGRDLTLPQRA